MAETTRPRRRQREPEMTKTLWIGVLAILASVTLAIGGFTIHELRSTRTCMHDHEELAAHPKQEAAFEAHVERANERYGEIKAEIDEIQIDVRVVRQDVGEILRRLSAQ